MRIWVLISVLLIIIAAAYYFLYIRNPSLERLDSIAGTVTYKKDGKEFTIKIPNNSGVSIGSNYSIEGVYTDNKLTSALLKKDGKIISKI